MPSPCRCGSIEGGRSGAETETRRHRVGATQAAVCPRGRARTGCRDGLTGRDAGQHRCGQAPPEARCRKPTVRGSGRRARANAWRDDARWRGGAQGSRSPAMGEDPGGPAPGRGGTASGDTGACHARRPGLRGHSTGPSGGRGWDRRCGSVTGGRPGGEAGRRWGAAAEWAAGDVGTRQRGARESGRRASRAAVGPRSGARLAASPSRERVPGGRRGGNSGKAAAPQRGHDAQGGLRAAGDGHGLPDRKSVV